nr:response regulator [Pseudenhygromyxa sp. WMMC2535]
MVLREVAYVATLKPVHSLAELELRRELRSLRQTFDSFIEASPVAILTLDLDKRVSLWNRTAERVFGWTAEEIIGQPYPLVPPEEWSSFEALYERVIGGEGFSGVDGLRRCKDGSFVDLRMYTAPMRDIDGEVIGAMALLEDLREQRRLEERIRHSQKMEAVGRLAGGIAHDFNNLLTVIVGMCDLLGLDHDLSSSALERVEEIQRVSESARGLVAQLMTFSRRQVMRMRLLDLNAHLRESARMVKRLLGEGVALGLELPDAPVWVRVDPAQFDQILVNLAVNAGDAMPRGGELGFRTTIVEQPEGLGGGAASEHSERRFARLEVRDTGVGIPADVLPHIFDPFFTTKALGTGTGLGLANVYGIVQQSGGIVEVESEPQRGTCFHIYLPLAEAPRRAARVEGRRASLPPGHERILLVEDNDAVRKSTARLLGTLGYEVEVARDGAEALERVSAGLRVNMVLTDLSMPRMGGAELAKQLRAQVPELPIVFMSGNLDVAELKAEVEAGRATFLQKPVSLRVLAKTTREVLDRNAAA